MHSQIDDVAPPPSVALPRLPDTFVGREQALADLRALRSQTRLLTLTGPGGAGKTRLALHLAHEAVEFGAHTWFVSLAELTDPILLTSKIVEALGAHTEPNERKQAALIRYLRPSRALLILDNCEHLVAACAELAETLLTTCPDLRLLITSREALNVPDETVYVVPPLALPPEDMTDPAQLLTYGAVALFMQRARAVLPTFALTGVNAALVVRICRALDGVPLALELAAARLKVFSLEQILERLTSGLGILAGGYRTALPRQQTMHATIAWSYALLNPAEQRLLRRLAVCAGAVSLDLAEHMSGERGDACASLIAHLIEKSLMLVAPHDPPRYHMLEVIRQFGKEQLRLAHEEHEVYERYLTWIARLIAQAEPGLRGADLIYCLERLEAHLDHIREVFTWLLEQRRGDDLVTLSAALMEFWCYRRHIGEGIHWLSAGLALLDAQAPTLTYARGLNARGMLAIIRCEYDRAADDLRQAEAIFQAACSDRDLAHVWLNLGVLAFRRRQYATAIDILRRGLTVYSRSRDEWGQAATLVVLGTTAASQGQYAEAERYYQACLTIARSLGHTEYIARSLLNIGVLALLRHEYATGIQRMQESLELYQSLKDQSTTTYVLYNLGEAYLRQGSPTEAKHLYQQALGILTPQGDQFIMGAILEGMAAVALREHHVPLAIHLWAVATEMHQTSGFTRYAEDQALYEQALAQARAAVGDAAFVRAWAEGQRLPIADAFARIFAPDAEAPVEHPAADMRANVVAPPAMQTEKASKQPGQLRFKGLGPSAIERDTLTLTPAESLYAKQKELAFFLLTYPGSTRDQIGLALWPEASEEQVRANCRVAIYRLRQALGEAAAITNSGRQYAINPAFIAAYDVTEFLQKIAEAQRLKDDRPAEALRRIEAACALYHGDFLADLPTSEWLAQRREEVKREYLAARILQAELAFTQQEYERAQTTFRDIIAANPFHEEAHRGLMRCYLQTGEKNQAVKHYLNYAQLLQRELGATPDQQTTALIAFFLRAKRDAVGQ